MLILIHISFKNTSQKEQNSKKNEQISKIICIILTPEHVRNNLAFPDNSLE